MKQVLVIAGLDPSGGAGILADVAIVREHQLRSVGVVTATTVQDTTGVRAAHPIGDEIVGDQLAALCSDLELAAVKIGMLGDEATAIAIGRALEQTSAPVVWDPVLAPSRGSVALYRGSEAAALAALAPHLSLITPNVAEASALADHEITSREKMAKAGAILAKASGAAVLVKGGHLAGETAVDALVSDGEPTWFEGPRHPGGESVHGTGCALATAIACHLAEGKALADAVRAAKKFVAEKIPVAQKPGRGAAAII